MANLHEDEDEASGESVPTVSVKAATAVKVPPVPEFLHFERRRGKIAISELTEVELRAVGAAWTEALIEAAEAARDREAE